MEIDNDDYKLIKLCLKGRKEAFGGLVDKYHRRVYNLAFRLTNNPERSKDISQEAFIRTTRPFFPPTHWSLGLS